jgi:hypothetical protein
MSTSWALSVWPAVFGLYRGTVTVDLKADVLISGRDSGWYAARGCGDYSSISIMGGSTIKPWIYVPYGLRVLNALHQTQRRVGATMLGMQHWGRGFGGTAIGPPVRPSDEFDHRDFMQGISTFTPGSIRTYDWENDVVMSPVIESNNLLPQHWLRIKENGYSKLEAVGLIASHLDQIVGNALGNFDVLGFFDGAAGPQDPGAHGQPEN